MAESTSAQQVADRYRSTLHDAVVSGSAAALARATELGQAAATLALPLSHLLPIHGEIVRGALHDGDAALITQRAEAFLAAFLSPMERAHAQLRSAHAALLEEKRALEQLPAVLLEGVPAVVYVAPWHGRPGEMLFVSPQSEAVLGYDAPEWIADPDLWAKRLVDEDRERAIAERTLAQAESRAFVSEYRLAARDGRVVWIHDEARIVLDDERRPQFWQGVLLDITQRQAAEQAAAAAERVRLARELHDSVTQTLIALNMHARTMSKLLTLDPAQASAHLADLQSLAQTALAEVRVLLLETRPAEITQIALHQLLAQLVAAMRGRSQCAIELAADPVPVMAPDVQVAVYRVAQEALNNLTRHAGARFGWVRLQGNAEGLLLTVRDDGVGFDLDAVPAGHLGLLGMHERAQVIGGRLTVISAPGAGTTVRLAWPAPDERSPA